MERVSGRLALSRYGAMRSNNAQNSQIPPSSLFAALISALLSVPAAAQTCATCSVGGDLSGSLPNPKVQSVTGAAGAFNFASGAEFLPRNIASTTAACTAGELAWLTGTPPVPYWCTSSAIWLQFPLFDTSGNLPIGNPSSPAQGSVIIYSGTSGGQISLTVPSTLSSAYIATLPAGTTTLAGLAVSNAYTNSNDFTQGTLTVPNSSGYAPTAEAAAGYDTAQHKYVTGGSASITGSLARVDSFQVPAPGSADLICARAGDTVGGHACSNTSHDGTTLTNFATSFAVPAGFLILNKSLRVTAAFSTFSPSSNVEDFQLALNAGSTLVYSSANPIAGLPASLSAISFEITWNLVAVTAPGSNGYVYVSGTVPAVPGAALSSLSNVTSQPVKVNFSTAETIQAAVAFQTTSACTGFTSCPGNGLELRWLRVEEIN